MVNRKVEIQEACKILREIMAPLEKERRVEILKKLPPGVWKTFGELQADTGIPISSLHDHLKVLVELGYVRKTDERPARYTSNEYVEKLCELAAYWRMKKLEELTKKLSEYQLDEGDITDITQGTT
jgi:DNA-binding transcriptional ArsR family regulator